MADDQQTTIDERLDALAGPADENSAARVRRSVHGFLCPCLDDRECRWPNCAQIGDGVGHYP